VAAEDGDAGGAEAAAAHVMVVGWERAQRGLAVHGGASTVLLGDDGPELLPEVFELADQVESFGVHLEQGLVVGPELVEELATMGSQAVDGGTRQAGGETVEEEGLSGAGLGSAVGRRLVVGVGHGGGSLVGRGERAPVRYRVSRDKCARGV